MDGALDSCNAQKYGLRLYHLLKYSCFSSFTSDGTAKSFNKKHTYSENY